MGIDFQGALRGVQASTSTAIWIAAGGGLIALVVLLAVWLSRKAEREAARRSRPTPEGGREAAYVNLRRQPAGAPHPEDLRRSAVAPAPTPVPATAAMTKPGEAPTLKPAGETEDSSAARLKHALHDPDPFVRIAVIAGLIGQHGADEIIVGALDDDYPQVRREAVRALGEIGGARAAQALSVVVQRDPSSEVREEAVAALAAIIERRAGGERPPSWT